MQVPRTDGLLPDRFVEVDLDWFGSADDATAEEFVGRVAPLLAGHRELRGIVLNAGFLVDILTEFDGDPDMSLPMRSQRCRRWAARSYRDLAELVAQLRAAADRYGLGEVRIGVFVAGVGRVVTGSDIYDLHSDWCDRHPELYPFDLSPLPGPDLDPRVPMRGDRHRYASRRDGIAEGTSFGRFLADQWAAVAEVCDLDAVHLRDGFWGPMLYTRRGPDGVTASADPEENAGWTAAVAELFAAVKQARPDALVLAYTSGIGATAEWRCGCVDSETVLAAGGVDVLVDQTWGGAWQDWWDDLWKGWTNQHANLLSHAVAVRGAERRRRRSGLDRPRIRHYKLIETWDGWEPFDTVHLVPGKLRWAMWAWSHAAVVTPDGLEVPDGTYISWMNDRDLNLLDEAAVDFVAGELGAAEDAASRMASVGGPLAVFDRDAVVDLTVSEPDRACSEHLEDAVALLMKWATPVLGATRADWLDHLDGDGVVMQAGGAGRTPSIGPMVVVGRTAAAGAVVQPAADGAVLPAGYRREAFAAGEVPVDDLPPTGWVHHAADVAADPGSGVVLATAAGEAFVVADGDRAWWRPPELADPANPLLPRSQYGSVASAAVVARWLARRGRLRPDVVPFAEPVTVSWWRDVDDRTWILAGNLETGWLGDARRPRHVGIDLDMGPAPVRIEMAVPSEGCAVATVDSDGAVAEVPGVAAAPLFAHAATVGATP